VTIFCPSVALTGGLVGRGPVNDCAQGLIAGAQCRFTATGSGPVIACRLEGVGKILRLVDTVRLVMTVGVSHTVPEGFSSRVVGVA